ncbi:MAG: ATP-binding protein [Gelidibacter sp.]
MNAFVCGENKDGLVITNYRLPYFNNKISKDICNLLEKQLDFYVGHYSKKEKNSFYEYVLEHTAEFKHLPEDIKRMIFESPSYTISMVAAKHSIFNINDFEGKELSENDIDILKRFTKVFDQAYIRFLDLQKAEAQAKEAQIEAALERVRSRSMAMHKSEELKEVIKIVYQQLVQLKINLDHAGFVVDYIPRGDWHFWIADEHDVPSKITHPFFKSVWANQFIKAKENGLDYFATNLNFEEKNKFYNELLTYIPGLTETARDFYLSCPGLAATTVLFDNVSLYIENFSGIPYSDEENDTLMRFGKVFQQTYTRFQDLLKAEAQIREARIETALERMRSVALNIRTTEEVLLVAESMYKELKLLDFNNIRNAQIVIDLKQNDTYLVCIHSDDTSEIIRESRYETSPIIQQLYDELDASNDAFYQKELKGAEFKRWLEWRKSITETIDDRILEATSISFYLFSIGEGHLGISAFNTISEEKVEVLQRFRNVFEMAYRRFIDLQKSEAQAREAKIEAALEKVRSRTMAMQKSEELPEAANNLFLQVQELGIPAWSAGYCIWTDDKKGTTAFMSSEGEIQTPFLLPNVGVGYNFQEPLQNGETFHVEELGGKLIGKHYEFMRTLPTVGKLIDDLIKAGHQLPTFQIFHICYFKYGYVMFITYQSVPEAHDIFKRFSKVFEQTYTRFLDLQKAEAQAKEAKIEAALEKVRSVALSLTKSEDMLDIAKSLFEQLLDLGFTKMRNAIIDIHNDDNESFIDYDYSHDMSSAITPFSFYGDPVIEQQIKQIESSNDAFFEIELKGKQIDELIETRLRNGEKDDPRLHQTEHLTYNLYSFGNGAIGISNFGILSDDQKAILKRFRNVFTFAYKRYTDLHKAELQARESLIEIGLERVRSRTLAMQTSDELAETAVVVFKQLIDLGIEPNRLYIGIVQEENKHIEMWATDEDGSKIGSKVIFDSKRNASVHKIFTAWKKQQKSLNFMMEGKELATYLNYLNKELGISVTKAGFQKKRFQNIAFFSKGLIGIAAPEEQPQETIKLLERFASVFNLTYTRFKDLKIAEAQSKKAEEDLINLKLAKKSAEDALAELQHTQKQLIQSEKMASLGELTAGIAHEIQNPLNFVNNFSEVSNELINEMNEEIEKGDLEEAKFIMADIKSNLEKISHHGRRAEAIVKGMLQHSRTSSAEKEPTDINKLADEYFRLAYHGLRAKDRAFNATLETDYDDTIGLIPLIPQDIGRVILNLITNAFYAVNEKQKSPIAPKGGTKYEPTVKVSTKLISPLRGDKGRLIISVKDNGNGIPKHVLDKIFQPFFTTKPTGQGTGLGLSMSYDIITKGHGGELTVETEEGKGTEFKIALPINL